MRAAEAGGAEGEEIRRRTLALLDHADDLAARAGLTEALVGSPFLPSAYRARLRVVAASLAAEPDAAVVAAAAGALAALREHRLARLLPDRTAAATMAVRLLRWLEAEPAPVRSVGGGVATQLADGGWVDRALTAVWAGESVDDPVVSRAYQTVFEAARRRRDVQDESFAGCSFRWAEHATAQVPAARSSWSRCSTRSLRRCCPSARRR